MKYYENTYFNFKVEESNEISMYTKVFQVNWDSLRERVYKVHLRKVINHEFETKTNEHLTLARKHLQ